MECRIQTKSSIVNKYSFSGYYQTYDGFPQWLVDKLKVGAEKQFPWPLAGIENWFCGYITYEAI